MFLLIQIEVAIVPSAQYSTAVVEPYNAVFSTHESLMNSDCALFFDNASLYNMLSKKLEMYAPKYKDINRMVCQVSQLLLALSDIQSDHSLYLHTALSSLNRICSCCVHERQTTINLLLS